MKNWSALLLAAALLGTVCAGCAAGTKAEEPPQGVTLNVITSFGGEDGNRRSFEAAVGAYETSTGNRVNDGSDVSSEEWKTKVLTDFETGSEPDVLFFFTNADAEPFIRAKKVVSLDEIRLEYPDFASNMDDAKLPVASDGKCYTVPVMGYWENMFVNTAVLAQCGVAVPDDSYTWEQFLADCQTIRSNGFTPVACSLVEMPHYWFEFAVLNNGGAKGHLQIPVLDAAGRLVDDAASRAWIDGLEDIRTLYEMGAFPDNTLTAADAETVAMFGDGEAAFLIDGSWKVGFFAENYAAQLENYTICYVPAKAARLPDQTIGGISTGYFITRKAWDDPLKREAAVMFVSQLTSDEVIRSFVTTEVTALREPPQTEELNALYRAAARVSGGAASFTGAVQDAIAGEARSALFACIPNIVTGKMTAHDAVEQAMRLNGGKNGG